MKRTNNTLSDAVDRKEHRPIKNDGRSGFAVPSISSPSG